MSVYIPSNQTVTFKYQHFHPTHLACFAKFGRHQDKFKTFLPRRIFWDVLIFKEANNIIWLPISPIEFQKLLRNLNVYDLNEGEKANIQHLRLNKFGELLEKKKSPQLSQLVIRFFTILWPYIFILPRHQKKLFSRFSQHTNVIGTSKVATSLLLFINLDRCRLVSLTLCPCSSMYTSTFPPSHYSAWVVKHLSKLLPVSPSSLSMGPPPHHCFQ